MRKGGRETKVSCRCGQGMSRIINRAYFIISHIPMSSFFATIPPLTMRYKEHTCHTHVTHMVHTWYTHGTHMSHTCHTHGTHMSHNCHRWGEAADLHGRPSVVTLLHLGVLVDKPVQELDEGEVFQRIAAVRDGLTLCKRRRNSLAHNVLTPISQLLPPPPLSHTTIGCTGYQAV